MTIGTLPLMKIHLFNERMEIFLTTLEKPTIAKMLRTLDLLEMFGNKLGMPHSKSLQHGLFELRIRGAQEVRVIYTFHKNTIVLLYGFVKKTNKISKKDFEVALKNKKRLDESITHTLYS